MKYALNACSMREGFYTSVQADVQIYAEKC